MRVCPLREIAYGDYIAGGKVTHEEQQGKPDSKLDECLEQRCAWWVEDEVTYGKVTESGCSLYMIAKQGRK